MSRAHISRYEKSEEPSQKYLLSWTLKDEDEFTKQGRRAGRKAKIQTAGSVLTLMSISLSSLKCLTRHSTVSPVAGISCGSNGHWTH